jgi:hypothetical protein
MSETQISGETYKISSTSVNSASFENVVIHETKTFRKIVIAKQVRESHESDSKIEITILTQRKKEKDEWENVQEMADSCLKAGESKKIILDSSATAALHKTLNDLHEIAKGNFFKGEKRLLVIDLEEAEDIQKLLKILQGCGEEVILDLARSSSSEIQKKFAIAKIQEDRKRTVEEFERNLGNKELSELYWQKFFEKNTWIFGLAMECRFLHLVQSQPVCQSAGIDGKGSQRGDFLMCTGGAAKFCVPIEIKTPFSNLLKPTKYRNGCWELGADLVGGCSQIQADCLSLDRRADNMRDNQHLLRQGITTIYPKGILVIGNTEEFEEDMSKIQTFELFRLHKTNPQIITFDEVLEKARHILTLPLSNL